MKTPISTIAPAKGAQQQGHEKPDAAILAAWGRRSVAHAIYNTLPFKDEGEGYTAEEQVHIDIIDEAEGVICDAIATTPRGVEMQLWVAFNHMVTKREDDEAVNIMDLDWFLAKIDDFDWQEQLILAALRSLRAQNGGAA